MKIVNNIQGTLLPSIKGGARGWVSLLPSLYGRGWSSLLPFLGKGLGVGFVCLLMASCANYDELDVQPQLELGDPVFAQFTISIPKSAGSGTRATDVVVQSAENFRGMDNIKLFAFAETDITASSQTPGSIGLIQMLKPTQQTVNNNIPSGQLLTGSKAVLFGDVQIPSGTNSFLFYAKAYDNVSTVADKFNYGTLTPDGLDGISTTPAAFSFSPEAITTATNSNDKRTAIITYLNSIKNATDGTTTWATASANNVILGNLYNKFITMTAGSSNNLQAAIEDLYNAVRDNSNTVAQAIKTAIAAGDVTITTNSTTDPSTVTFGTTLAGYPSTSDNLPDGAAHLTITNGSFAYVETSASASSMNVGALTNYTYPPCLYYRVESGIKVSNTSEAEHYTPSATWGDNGTYDILKNYTDGYVTNNTRSVVMVAPVQYAVGRLDVRLRSSQTTSLVDYNDTPIDYSNIKMTGILIGGQKPVDWEFKPLADDLSANPAVIIPEYTLYEDFTRDGGIGAKSITNNAFYTGTDKLTVASTTDHTLMTRALVLETAGDDEEKVNVALEFVNNTGADFAGNGGEIIPNGCKFYLVGALDMKDIPAATISTMGNKVFKQDVVTLANFTINDLKKAVNTIPNLQAPQLELGLNIDVTWETGFTQTIVIEQQQP